MRLLIDKDLHCYYMTTRSGRDYKPMMSMDETPREYAQSEGEEGSARSSVETPTTELRVLMQLFLQDRQRLEMELSEERRRRERDMDDRVQQMQEQMAELRGMATGRAPGGSGASGADALKLTKLSESDNVEAYFTTFERLMRAYEIAEMRWA